MFMLIVKNISIMLAKMCSKVFFLDM